MHFSNHVITRCLFLLVTLLLFSGCNTQNRMTHLKDTLEKFNQQVRWGVWPGAASFVTTKERQKWLDARISGAAYVKISDVKMVRVISKGPRSTEAQVIVSLTWYRTSDMKVQTSHWLQTWKHDRHGWQLHKDEKQVAAPLPVRKKTPGAQWP